MRSRIGHRMPLASTGVGKALMLDMSESDWQRHHAHAVRIFYEMDGPHATPEMRRVMSASPEFAVVNNNGLEDLLEGIKEAWKANVPHVSFCYGTSAHRQSLTAALWHELTAGEPVPGEIAVLQSLFVGQAAALHLDVSTGLTVPDYVECRLLCERLRNLSGTERETAVRALVRVDGIHAAGYEERGSDQEEEGRLLKALGHPGNCVLWRPSSEGWQRVMEHMVKSQVRSEDTVRALDGCLYSQDWEAQVEEAILALHPEVAAAFDQEPTVARGLDH